MSNAAVIVDHLWKRYHKRFGTSTLWSLFGRREQTDDEFWALNVAVFSRGQTADHIIYAHTFMVEPAGFDGLRSLPARQAALGLIEQRRRMEATR
jgi:hypothetical protein